MIHHVIVCSVAVNPETSAKLQRMTNKGHDADFVADLIADEYRRRFAVSDALQSICGIVRDHYRLTDDQMRDVRLRKGRYSLARHIAMWIMRDITGAGLVQIADSLGLHHTLVSVAVRNVNNMLECYPDGKDTADALALRTRCLVAIRGMEGVE